MKINIIDASFKLHHLISLIKKAEKLLLEIDAISFDDQDYLLLQMELSRELISKIQEGLFYNHGEMNVY